MDTKTLFITLILTVVIAMTATVAGGDDLIAKYEGDDREFEKFTIGHIRVYFHQRMLDEAIVEGDYIVYQFDEDSKELLKKRVHWRSDLPEHVTPEITEEEAESMVRGEVQSTRLYIISPESDVFPLRPTPQNACWIVRSVDDNGLVITIIDAAEGRLLGLGVPPPYTGFSLSGPQYFSPCSGTWTSWYENTEYWFNTMGYFTEAVQWPIEEEVRNHVQSCSTAMFYELAHGNSDYFQSGCIGGNDAEYTYSSEIEDWIEDYTKMPFTFIGSCDGMCYLFSGTFSNAFRKGSLENTVTVGYCHMSEPQCDDAWVHSLDWQDAMFSYMNQEYTVKDAFDQALADYPMCVGCMRFFGDANFAVVPLVKRCNTEPVLLDGYVTPGTGNIETWFTYQVIYFDADGDVPSITYVYIDGDPYEMEVQLGADSIYLCETMLSEGTHDYYFYFEDGYGGTCCLPESGVFAGPDVLGPPVANFSADSSTGMVPLPIQFQDESTGYMETWFWEFGDGDTSNARNPFHIYEAVGRFDVTLVVSGPIGEDTLTQEEYILARADTMTAENTSATPGKSGKRIRIAGINSDSLAGYGMAMYFDTMCLDVDTVTLDGTCGEGAALSMGGVGFDTSLGLGYLTWGVVYTFTPPWIPASSDYFFNVVVTMKDSASLPSVPCTTYLDLENDVGLFHTNNSFTTYDDLDIYPVLVDGRLIIGNEIDFMRGDANADMFVEMSDAIFTLKFLYVPGSDTLLCNKAGDTDDNGTVEMADAIYTLKYLYVPGSPEPPAPGPIVCGHDPTEDDLDCGDHPCMGGRARGAKKMKSMH